MQWQRLKRSSVYDKLAHRTQNKTRSKTLDSPSVDEVHRAPMDTTDPFSDIYETETIIFDAKAPDRNLPPKVSSSESIYGNDNGINSHHGNIKPESTPHSAQSRTRDWVLNNEDSLTTLSDHIIETETLPFGFSYYEPERIQPSSPDALQYPKQPKYTDQIYYGETKETTRDILNKIGANPVKYISGAKNLMNQVFGENTKTRLTKRR